jgi:hypothetical protein
MLENLSQSVTFYAFFTAARQGKTGLTVTVDVRRGTTLVVTAAVATEVGGGLYRYTLGSGNTGTAESYAAVFKTTDATVDQQHVPSLWVVGPVWVQEADAMAADYQQRGQPVTLPTTPPAGYGGPAKNITAELTEIRGG